MFFLGSGSRSRQTVLRRLAALTLAAAFQTSLPTRAQSPQTPPTQSAASDATAFLRPDYLPLNLGNRWIYTRAESRFKKTDTVRVEMYGQQMMLNQVASIAGAARVSALRSSKGTLVGRDATAQLASAGVSLALYPLSAFRAMSAAATDESTPPDRPQIACSSLPTAARTAATASSLNVPGGVICHTADESDANGRLARRSTLTLIDYGLTPKKEHSGLFNRVRSRGHREGEAADETGRGHPEAGREANSTAAKTISGRPTRRASPPSRKRSA